MTLYQNFVFIQTDYICFAVQMIMYAVLAVSVGYSMFTGLVQYMYQMIMYAVLAVSVGYSMFTGLVQYMYQMLWFYTYDIYNG